jgi:glycosyltransferase involved in cell wall biosynthesis
VTLAGTDSPRVLDIVNTDHAALNFLVHRIGLINEHTEFGNDLVCSPGPHLGRLALRDARVTPMPIPRGLAPVGIGRLLAALLAHLRAHPYTVVHTHNSITGAVGRIAARLAGVPLTIHTTHGFHFHEHMAPAARLPWVAAERWLAGWCDVLLTQNREELGDIRRLRLRPRLGVIHVGNGIDLRRFRRRPAPPRNPRPVVLSVGRLEPVKNHAMLFRALARLAPGERPLVWLVGDGPSRPRYAARIVREGLADCVQFLGYRYDIPELTAAADVAVLTSVKEGMPRALMEAMAVGVPVVATDVKGSREVVRHGRSGFLVPLGDDAALADALARLLGSAALRAEMGAYGAEHARRHFDEDRVVERLVAVYRSALAARGAVNAWLPPSTAPAELGCA